MGINCSLKKNRNLKACQKRPKPFFSYFGGKSRVADKIISKFPKHQTFIEPMIGGGSVYWKNTIADKFVINDLDKDVMQVYKTAKNSPRNIKSCNVKRVNKGKFNKIKNRSNKSACDVIKMYKHSFSGTGNSFVEKGHKFNTELLTEQHKEKLKKTKILNQDFRKVLNKYNRRGNLIYLDPPYVKAGSAYKKHGITPQEVCDAVKKVKKAKVFLSYDNNPEVRRDCKGLKKHKISVPYSNPKGGTYSNKNGKTELLLEN